MSDNPKLFISYSWSNPDHQAWVIDLATELMGAGTNVILDKWDLREGQDAYAFMEQMVTDASIKKVILICDQSYATKADSRNGGVGAEAQIITPEIYKSQDQSKFVAVIRERDGNGNPYTPIYYSSRIYIDLSDASTYAENFERLLRWIHDQPLHKKPEIGAKPAFLTETKDTVHIATAAVARRAIDAIKNGRDYAVPALTDYFILAAKEFEKFRITEAEDIPFDESVVRSIEDFTPFRNEIVSIFLTVAVYQDNDETRNAVHRFFESLVPYLDKAPTVSSWNDTDFDNFRFFIQELFLYWVAAQIKHERFEAIASLLAQEFYVKSQAQYGLPVMMPFTIFNSHNKSLGIRNQRLQLRRFSLSADLMKERCKSVGVEFDQLMTADFILYIRSRMDSSYDRNWFPDTLVFVGHYSRQFEIFARSKSMLFFDRVKFALGVGSKQALGTALAALEENPSSFPRWQFESINPRALLGFDALATKP
jgi:TIR domain